VGSIIELFECGVREGRVRENGRVEEDRGVGVGGFGRKRKRAGMEMKREGFGRGKEAKEAKTGEGTLRSCESPRLGKARPGRASVRAGYTTKGLTPAIVAPPRP
jgi:hypothetical protein